MAKPDLGDRRGTVFVIFALLLPILLTGVLGLISLSGYAAVRADLQGASNAAANAVLADLNAALQISATPDALVTDLNKQSRAELVVKSLLGSRSDLKSLTTQVTTDIETITVTVSAVVDETTAGFLWTSSVPISAKTTISWNKADQLQIAIAIDSGSSTNKAPLVQIRMPTVLNAATKEIVNILSALPNHPDVALSLVPFTEQVSTDPTRVTEFDSGPRGRFYSSLQARFSLAGQAVAEALVPSARANITVCYNDPIIPSGTNGSAFGGKNQPMPSTCKTSVQPIQPLAKISKPLVNGKPVLSEATNSPVKTARDDMLKAIDKITPAGCRNLSMGVTWSLAELPTDNNPKIIFLIARGDNSRGASGRTSECPGSGSTTTSSSEQLDGEFIEACKLVRDPKQNGGRRLDLVVLRILAGNPATLQSCASFTGGEINYFSVSTVSNLGKVFEDARTRLLQAAAEQIAAANDDEAVNTHD